MTLRKLTYYCVDKDNQINAGFKKELYTDERSNVALVHYLGDDTLASEFPIRMQQKTDADLFLPLVMSLFVSILWHKFHLQKSTTS